MAASRRRSSGSTTTTVEPGQPRQRRQQKPGRSRADHEDRQARRRREAIDAVDRAGERLGEATNGWIRVRRKDVGQPTRDNHLLGHATVEVHAERLLVRAEVFVAEPAISADAAVEVRLDRDEVALPDVADRRADGIDDARDLVAEHGPGPGVVRALEDPCVRPADPDRQRPESDLEGSGVGRPGGRRTRACPPRRIGRPSRGSQNLHIRLTHRCRPC